MAKIHFVSDVLINEGLGIMYLSAYVKQHGHEVELSFLSDGMDTVLKEIGESQPDIVGFSVMTPQEGAFRRAATAIKEKFNHKIIWGGPHCTFMPELVSTIEELDLFCVGEGEEAILSVMNQIDGEQNFSGIDGLWHRKPNREWVSACVGQLHPLDDYPPPDRELYYSKSKLLRSFSFKRVMSGRGCPYRCNFCFEPAWNDMHKGKGKLLRRKSVDNMIAELQGMVEKYPTKQFHFSDDSFNLNRKTWIKEFLPRYKADIGLPFTANIAIGMVDEEFVAGMVEAGCVGVTFGLESGNEHFRMNVLEKNVSDKQVIEATNLFKKYKLKCFTFNIVGIPTETLDNVIETLQMNKDCGVYNAWPNIMKIYKGTNLAEYALKHNLSEAEGTLTYKAKDPTGDHKHLDNVLWLAFYFLRVPFLMRFAKPIIRSPITKYFKFMTVFTYWPFLRFYNVGLWDAFRFFLASRDMFMDGIGAGQDDEYRELSEEDKAKATIEAIPVKAIDAVELTKKSA